MQAELGLRRYHVELAIFSPRNRQELCLQTRAWFEVTNHGVVAPWCMRRDIAKLFTTTARC